jgi:hypothetical protein
MGVSLISPADAEKCSRRQLFAALTAGLVIAINTVDVLFLAVRLIF